MKMKALCEATGLTDRAIRHYIDEALISPAYTENYLGRKTFDFSEGDIQQLRDIAVLRKFGFSIAEIREMIQKPERIMPIARDLQTRKQSLIDGETKLLQALLRLDANGSYTVTQLAACLSAPVSESPLPAEDESRNIAGLLIAAVTAIVLFAVTWIPVVLSVLVFILSLTDYSFPVFRPRALVYLLISLLPTFFTVLLPKIIAAGKRRRTFRSILLILCVLSIPVSCFMSAAIVSHSETTDFRNYRDFDPDCLANRSDLFQDLFPKWPHYFVNVQQPDGHWDAVYLDAHYYYQFSYGFDYTYDVYAEWPLEEAEFYKEVDRAKAVFDAHAPSENDYRKFLTLQKGPYTCLILYHGTTPFEAVTGSYTYCIFAYSEETLTVRYIYCDSLDDGADQPYYLTLDWE